MAPPNASVMVVMIATACGSRYLVCHYPSSSKSVGIHCGTRSPHILPYIHGHRMLEPNDDLDAREFARSRVYR
ncbi:hypothetical protein SCLCIDRAFT_1210351 [Scleroderma citrinum Foug A]|uniref:Uncharacterized protein n=1 Tax=Scleroderma citrinum Foug A TaxID=1036808 RepID=A0A0C3AQU3_9AGAM|nr:hypothetical protein SCLCIDRAFT_1210351 [Scleroderma citrinum Foug A]